MSDASDRPPRVLLAIGNPERERQLLTALRDGGWTIAGRCLDGPSLVQQAIAGNVDVVLASAGLHRLTGESFIAVREADVPMVLLAGPAEAEAYDGLSYVLPAASDGPVIIAALHEAIRRGAVVSRVAADGLSTPERPNHGDLGDGEVIALASGKGAPGTTTVAIGLAAALSGRKKSVALVDADLRGGAVGPYLDLDPRRGLSGLSVEPSNRPERVLDELQDGPGFAILTGIERPEAQERLAPERIAGAVSALQERFDTVLIDNGETLSGVTSATGVALLRSAERVLLVTTADLIGLWNARASLRFVTESLGVPAEAVSAIINHRHGSEKYGSPEVERALGIRVVAAIPEDRRAARRARADQAPITAGGGKAAHAIAELASRLAGAADIEERPAAEEASTWRRWRRQPAEGRR
jgi:MinD-like ATPase involved in chromosome partitioning or flagellar assembly